MSPSTVFVGIDPSITNTGVVALSAQGKLLAWGNSKQRRAPADKSTPYHSLLRLREISDYVLEIVQSAALEAQVFIGYENYSFESQNFAFTLGEHGGVLKLALVEEGYQLDLVEPKRLKKFAVGAGAAGKEAIMQAAREECLGIQHLNSRDCTDDLCDAYFLAKWAWYRHAPRLAACHDTSTKLLRKRLELCKLPKKAAHAI